MIGRTVLWTSILLLATTGVDAQSITNRVTGTVAGVGSVGAGTAAGVGSPASQSAGAANPFSALNESYSGSSTGGELPGAYGTKIGGRDVQFRGAVGVGSDSSAFKAGAGIRF